MQDYETVKRRAAAVKMAKQMFFLAFKKGQDEKAKQYLDEMYQEARNIMTDNPNSIAAAVVYANASQTAFEYYEKKHSPLFTASFANFVFRRLKRNLDDFPDSEEAQTILLGTSMQLLSSVQTLKGYYDFLFQMKKCEEERKGDEDNDDEIFFKNTLNGMVQAAAAICATFLVKTRDLNPDHPIIDLAENILGETHFDFDEEIGNLSLEQCADKITELLDLFAK